MHAATLTPDRAIEKAKSSSVGDVPDAAAERNFGEYELIEEVARGGMGVIYKARHVKLNRITALKMILSGRFSSKDELQRFYVEAEAAARLDHSGIVPVYEIGEVEGQAFFAMKFIEGGSLADRLEDFRSDPRTAIQLLANVARAVHHAHQRGILHRDLKPANILIDENDQPLITDLGLAKSTAGGSNLTNTGAVLGTPSYMPPEQAAGNAVITTAVDVYSLGAIMYELLTGEPPYRGETAVETVLQVREGKLDSPRKKCPTIDRDLELICLKCLEHVPEERFESALALANDLESWLANEPISIRSRSFPAQAIRWFQRNRRLAYVGFAVLMGILVTMPFALAFIAGRDFSDVYDHFPPDQRPWLFSLGRLPKWLNVMMGLSLILVLWPTLGFLNALVGRPTNVWSAVRTGCVTSALLMAVFSVLLGWMPLLRATNDDIRISILTEAIWQKKGQTPQDAAARINKHFAGLEDIPEYKRAEVVADRMRSDRLASAPYILMMILIIECSLLLPVVYGTALGYVLLQRGHRRWVAYFRYTVAWWLAGLTIMFLLSLFGAALSAELVVKLLLVAVSGTLFWLTVRRWKKNVDSASAALEMPGST